MGDCKFCGQSAGFFRSYHDQCQALHNAGTRQLVYAIIQASRSGVSLQQLSGQIDEAVKGAFVSDSERREAYAKGWIDALDGFLHDGPVTEDAEKRLVQLQRFLGLSTDELDRQNGAYTRLVHAAVIRQVTNGVIPKHKEVGGLSLNLQKGEQVVWVFRSVSYLEDRIRREYVGSSSGMSFYVAKGMYYRVGAFKGQPIERTQRVHVDTGLLAITDKHVYFAGPAKSFRVPYAKIVSFQPFSDGFAITRDAATAKPQVFVTGNGWFSYNLVTNLARL